MKKNILIISIIFIFAISSFGELPKLRRGDNQAKAFITNQLKLLGLTAGKITKSGDDFIIIVNGFSPKTSALTRTAPFKSFSLKVKLKRTKPIRRAIIKDGRDAKGIIIVDNKNAKGIIIVNSKNTKLIILQRELVGANFIVDDNDMPAGIIVNN